jgi:hypothetical protein
MAKLTTTTVHHHVHEHVQPVINKETVQPHVVHTTIPIQYVTYDEEWRALR